ncbi:MAG: DUF3592 domain-containing protein, partial [Chloroflexota bacterium]
VLILGQFGGQAITYVQSSGWETVAGTIVTSDVLDVSDTSGTRFTGQVVYSYTFEGETYENDAINLLGNLLVRNEADAAQMVVPYPVGAMVDVYVNPDNPSESVLDRSLSGGLQGLIGFGAMMLLLSLGLGARLLFSKPNTETDDIPANAT